jgi:hypothetical protein
LSVEFHEYLKEKTENLDISNIQDYDWWEYDDNVNTEDPSLISLMFWKHLKFCVSQLHKREKTPEGEAVDISREIEILDAVENEVSNESKEELRKVRDKLEFFGKGITCVVCLVNKVQILIVPCGHVVVCSECSLKLSRECPFCRTKIENKITAILP